MSEKIDQLERLSQLLDQGRITPEEYRKLKSEVLAANRDDSNVHDAIRDTSRAAPSDSTRGSTRSVGAILGWAIAGFVLGVLLNGVIGAIGIGISGDFAWDTKYQSTWVRTLVPYATAVAAGLVAMARGRDKRTIYLDAAIMIGVAIVVAVAFVIDS